MTSRRACKRDGRASGSPTESGTAAAVRHLPVTDAECEDLLELVGGMVMDTGSLRVQEPAIFTTPGCDSHHHRGEIQELVFALATGRDLDSQFQRMHCGCALLLLVPGGRVDPVRVL